MAFVTSPALSTENCKSSLHEGERRQGKNGDEVTLRKVLHDLVLDVLDISISPEHDREESNGLRNREQKIRCHHATQHIIRTSRGEQSRRGRVGKVVAQTGESETGREESEGTTSFATNQPTPPIPTASLSSERSSGKAGLHNPCKYPQ